MKEDEGRTACPTVGPVIVVGLALLVATILLSVGLMWVAATLVHAADPEVTSRMRESSQQAAAARPEAVLESAAR